MNTNNVLSNKIDFLITYYKNYKQFPKIDLSDESIKIKNQIFKLLEPKNVLHYTKKRIGNENDGGYIFLTPFLSQLQNKQKIAYSFGISTYDPFSLEMAKNGFEVFQYDGTIDKGPYDNPQIKFFKFNISGSISPPPNCKNFSQILNDHMHNNLDIIMQIDIENHEWDFIESLTHDQILQIEQINIEFHNIIISNKEEIIRQKKIFEKINKTHQCIHIHANNNSNVCILNDFSFLPETLEVTYVRKINTIDQKYQYEFTDCYDEFPIDKLDAPCCSSITDIYIGKFIQNLYQSETIHEITEDSFITNIIFLIIEKFKLSNIIITDHKYYLLSSSTNNYFSIIKRRRILIGLKIIITTIFPERSLIYRFLKKLKKIFNKW